MLSLGIKDYAIGALVVGLGISLVTIAGQQAEIARGETKVARAEKLASDEKASREKAAREHGAKILELQTTHARSQQEKEDAFATEREGLLRARAADAADARGLRNRLAITTARGSQRTNADPVACERDQDRLEVLGRLVGEGQELLVEARSLLTERDGQVRRLRDQIAIDRAAVAP